ncbi:MAG: nucleoside deaminase [Caldilineaceae bacterium]
MAVPAPPPRGIATENFGTDYYKGPIPWTNLCKRRLKKPKKDSPKGAFPLAPCLLLMAKSSGNGHNRRVQKGSAILHAEMDALENAGRLTAKDYQRATLYSTLSPCDMCSGTALLYKIPKVVIGENVTFQGPEAYVRCAGSS